MPVITPDYSAQYEGDIEQELSRASAPPPTPKVEQPEAVAGLPAKELSPEARQIAERFNIPVEAKEKPKAPELKAAAPVVKAAPVKKEPTPWRKAGEPIKPEEAPMSAADVVSKAAKNAVPSMFNAVSSAYTAVTHPIDTLSAITDVAKGGISQLTDYLGINEDTPEEKQKKQAAIKILEDHYKNTYGSIEGFKKAFAEDPFGILMDASIILGGAGAGIKVATKAGAISKAGSLAKAAQVASKAAPYLDPVQLALKTAAAPLSVAREVTAKTSGLTSDMQKIAAEAGATGTASQREAFKRFYTGKADPSEYLNAVDNAIAKSKKAASNDYLFKKGSLSGGKVDISGAENAIKQNHQYLSSQGGVGGFEKLDEAQQRIQNLIDSIKSDPARQGVESIDHLKQQINELRAGYSGKTQAHIDNAYNEIKKALVAHDPEYAKLMEQYNNARIGINDAKALFSTGNRGSATAALNKALRSAKTASGKNIIDEMSQYDPNIKYMLAGAASNPMHGGVMRDIFDATASAALYHVNPILAMAPVLGASPKVIGGLNYYGGRAISPAVKVAKPLYRAYGAKGPYYAGTVEKEAGDTGQGGETDANAVRSVRNNNMGNIVDSDFAKNQPGYKGSDGKFAIFDTPEAGKAAADKLLKIKGQQGLNTARKLIDNWAPGAPEAYKEMVARAAGVGIDGVINLSDPDVRERILNVIRRFEGDKSSASGGRIERASGGAVNPHEKLVNRLMMLANKAKKGEEKATQALLSQPDEAVVKALSVAQEAI